MMCSYVCVFEHCPHLEPRVSNKHASLVFIKIHMENVAAHQVFDSGADKDCQLCYRVNGSKREAEVEKGKQTSGEERHPRDST